jgi:hypothetical protein
MGSIPNGSAPLPGQACARQIFKSTLPGRAGARRRKFSFQLPGGIAVMSQGMDTFLHLRLVRENLIRHVPG